jgi:hypothetical protein
LKRLGVQVYDAFVPPGLSPALRRACDKFYVEKDWTDFRWGGTLAAFQNAIKEEGFQVRRT